MIILTYSRILQQRGRVKLLSVSLQGCRQQESDEQLTAPKRQRFR